MEIGVVTVCFHAERTIARTKPVTARDWPAFEHIAVEGAPRNGTVWATGNLRPWRAFFRLRRAVAGYPGSSR